MNELKTNVNDIKSVAKILKKELALMDFKLSHSSALNLASRSLGFKNYQVYKGLLEKKKENFIYPKRGSEISKLIEREKLEKYPRIYNLFIKIGHTQKYNIYIERELSEDEYYYFLIFELKNSYTGRVFFIPQYNHFSFYIYPNIKEAKSDYSIEPYMGVNNIKYFDMIKHLNNKGWLNEEILRDLMNLIENIERDRKKLEEISNKYSKEELEERYRGQKND